MLRTRRPQRLDLVRAANKVARVVPLQEDYIPIETRPYHRCSIAGMQAAFLISQCRVQGDLVEGR